MRYIECRCSKCNKEYLVISPNGLHNVDLSCVHCGCKYTRITRIDVDYE